MISPTTVAAFCEAGLVFAPPPQLTVTEWAEQNIVLSTEDSATGGSRYNSRMAPYQRGMQDAVLEPGIEEVVFLTSAQVGKTLVLKNILGYYIKEDPAPIIWMVPTLDLAKRVSTQRIAPMLRDTPALSSLFDLGSRKVGNSTLEKSFPGGVLFLVGANSAAALSSMPIRIVLADEVSRYPLSAGPEGDPVNLAAKRQTSYWWNRKRVLASTPTIKGRCRISAAYERSDRRCYWVPCPHCSELAGHPDGYQVLKWKRLTKDVPPAVYPCEHCGVALFESDKLWMLAHGEWRKEQDVRQQELDAHRLQHSDATAERCPDCELFERRLEEAQPEDPRAAGFFLHEMYSPFVTWDQMVAEFKEAVHHRENPELLKTFVNLALAETWEDRGEVLDGNELMRRRESYPPPALPDGVTMVTAGVDVQADRLECEVVGWGKGEESWSIDVLRFEGDTTQLTGTGSTLSPWQRLEAYLRDARFLHARGIRLPIVAACIDSGFHTQEVYAWCKQQQMLDRRIFASKGVSGFGKPPINKKTISSRQRVKLYILAVDVLKETVYSRLRIEEPGAGYMHFSRENHSTPFLPEVEAVRLGNGPDYFAQLTAEKIAYKSVRGYPMRHWELRVPGSRNEALDMRVYAYGAFLSLSEKPSAMLERERKELLRRAGELARQRREHLDPNQLSLLTDAMPEENGADVRTEDAPDTPAPTVAPLPDSAAPNLGANEHLVAAQLDHGAPAEQPVEEAKPRQRFRTRIGGRW